jgi:hypothetical protein
VGDLLFTVGLGLIFFVAVSVLSMLWFRAHPSRDMSRALKQRELRESFLPVTPKLIVIGVVLVVVGLLAR